MTGQAGQEDGLTRSSRMVSTAGPLISPDIHADLALLAIVVEAGGFSKASAASGITKSRISRRIADLEVQLGVRLIQRSSRSFAPTPLALELAGHGQTIRRESEAALELTQSVIRQPNGHLRVASPSGLGNLTVGSFCVKFIQRYQNVVLTFDTMDGTRYPSKDGYDIVIHTTNTPLGSSDIIARRLAVIDYELVAAPSWIAANAPLTRLDDLAGRTAVGWWKDPLRARWPILSPEGNEVELPVLSRMTTNNMLAMREAALEGLGMARLPRRLSAAPKSQGRLQVVLPGYRPRDVTIYALYHSKRSLLAAGRLFLSELAQHLQAWTEGAGTELEQS